MTAKTHPFWMKPPRLSTGEEATPYPLSTNLLTTNVAGTGTMLFFRFQFALRPGHASGKVRGVFNTKWPCLAGTKMGPDLLSTAVGSDSYSAAPPPLSFFFPTKEPTIVDPPLPTRIIPKNPTRTHPHRPFNKKDQGVFQTSKVSEDKRNIKKQIWKKATSNQQILPT